MELNSLADVKLVGRALTHGWLTGRGQKRQDAIDAMFRVIEVGDDQMKVKAFEALIRADVADLKREEVAIKKQAVDDARRLRLLELIKHIPPGTLAQLASGNATTADSGREREGSGSEG
jgi:hypothetical protein